MIRTALAFVICCCTSTLSKPPAQTSSTAKVENDPAIYYPGRDPEALVDQDLIDALEESVWGEALGSHLWNLDLEQPVAAGECFSTGHNRIGLPFDVDFATLSIINTDNATRFGIWSGVISAIGDFYVYGAYVEEAGRATLIPLYSRVDQSSLSKIMGYGPRQYQCVFDEIATYQMNQNEIMRTSCMNTHDAAARSQILICYAAGAGSCWTGFVPGCIGSAICVISVLVNEYYFRNAYETEVTQNYACLCNDVAMRTTHPSIPIATAACSQFKCPANPGLFLPGIK